MAEETREEQIIQQYENTKILRESFNFKNATEQVRRIKGVIFPRILGGQYIIDKACFTLSALPGEYNLISAAYKANPWLENMPDLPSRRALDDGWDKIHNFIKGAYSESRVFRNRVSQRLVNGRYKGLKDIIWR
ncbi:hypothetical protein HN698_02455 [Candidatus Woesearchaeota archaeon]|jgi:hypothetical protein|nr:hypothetical protein [Candidatus Woesearchaeota archaeon]